MLKEALAANTIGGKVDDDSRFRAANLVTIPVNIFYYLGPVLVLVGTGAVVVAVSVLAAWVAQRAADRTNAGEVLRLAQ